MVDTNRNAAVEEAVNLFEKLFGPVRATFSTQDDFGHSAMEYVPGSTRAFETVHIAECEKDHKPAKESCEGFAGPVIKCTAEGFRALHHLELLRMLSVVDGQSLYHLCN